MLFTRCQADEGTRVCVKTEGLAGTEINEEKRYTTTDIFTRAQDGSTRQLTEIDGNEGAVVPSPSGQSIAFSVFPDYETGMDCRPYVMSLEGGEMTPLMSDKDTVCATVDDWSPDGEWILLNAYWDECCSDLYKVRPDGSDLKQLTNFCNEDEGAWQGYFVDGGKRVVFDGTDADSSGSRYVDGIFSVDSSGDHLRLLEKMHVTDFVPARDRRSFFVATHTWGKTDGEIFELDLLGRPVRQLTSNDLDEDGLAVSPDGSKLLFGSGELYSRPGRHAPRGNVIDLETGETTRLRLPPAARLDISEFSWAWSPDSREVAVLVHDRDWNQWIVSTSVRRRAFEEVAPVGAGLSVLGWLRD